MSVCCVLACLQLSALSPFWNYILFLFALCEQLLVGKVDVLQSLQTTIRNWKEARQIVMLRHSVNHVRRTDSTQRISQVISLLDLAHQLPGKSARWCQSVQQIDIDMGLFFQPIVEQRFDIQTMCTEPPLPLLYSMLHRIKDAAGCLTWHISIQVAGPQENIKN